MGWSKVNYKIWDNPRYCKNWLFGFTICFTGWSSVVGREHAVEHGDDLGTWRATHGQEILPLGPPVPEPLLPASAPMAAPFAGGRGNMDHSMNHQEMARNGKKWQLCWCWTMIDMMNAHCHDGWCDLVRCPEGLICMIWFSQSLCDFDMQHVLSDSWFGRPCLPHLLQSKQSATASCSRQGVPRFKQSCLLDHPLHSWDSWFQWKHVFWKELKLQTRRDSRVYPTYLS